MQAGSRHGGRRLAVVAVLAGAALLGACGGTPTFRSAPIVGAPTDKTIIRALTAVEATPEQRSAVLAAFDAVQPRLRALDGEARSIDAALAALDPRAAGFAEAVEPIAARAAAVTAERVRLQSRFDHDTALQLSDSQWSEWQGYFRRRSLYGDPSVAVPYGDPT